MERTELLEIARSVTPIIAFLVIFTAVFCCLGCTVWGIYKRRKAKIEAFNKVFSISVCEEMNKLEPSFCVICLEVITVGQKVAKCRCTNTFHTSCLRHWIEQAQRCPICSREIPPLQLDHNPEVLIILPPVPY